jgi:predicted O-methyltransferase YrrM
MKANRGWFPTERDHDWIEHAAEEPDAVVLEMEREGTGEDVPIVDRATGRVLAVLAAGRSRIVEVGTAIGYSTLWLSRGQPADGAIVTIDPDADRHARAREHWRSAGIPDKRITTVTEKALEAFERGHEALVGPFDLAFVDALKEEYGAYVEALVPRLQPGALLVVDNVLWSGRVSGSRPGGDADRHTADIRAFDEALLRDARFRATILPLGDGLLIAGFRG